MSTRIPGFKGEFLWELDIAEKQVTALAEAFPEDRYGWRPAESARSVSEVLVHVALGNLGILAATGIQSAPDLYGNLEGDFLTRMMAMVAKNDALGNTVTSKVDVLPLLKRSFDVVRNTFTQASDAELERLDQLFGERTSIRRVYLRLLCHLHEHMGQLIAYTRAMGRPAPWPDWRASGKEILEKGRGQ